MPVAKSAINEYLDRRMRSFLWMKRLTRAQIERELKQFKVKPEFKTEPWLHQLVCFYIGLCEPEFLFLLDMGLGKSKILADLITQFRRERSIGKALITVPRIINLGSWRDDLAQHSNLEPVIVEVEDIEEKWQMLKDPKGDLTIIDYQSLQWALCRKVKVPGKRGKVLVPDPKRMAIAKRLYGFIGIDESHKLSNDQSLWYSLLEDLTSTASKVYATTGTLFGSDPAELFPQFKLVDQGRTFGENPGLFRDAFFSSKEHPFKGQVWTYNRRRAPDLHRMLQNCSIRYDEHEVPELDLPPVVMRPVNLLMGDEQRGHYLRALEGVINASNGHQVDDLKASWSMLRRIASGYMKWTDTNGEHLVHFKRNPKLDALERLIDEVGTKKMVISYEYTETGQLISNRLKELKIKHEWLYGGSGGDRIGYRDRFMSDPDCQVFLMNSMAGGTGTDGLQKVSHYLVFFESPPNPRNRKQTEKRIDRPGQTHRSFIYDLVMRQTVDVAILQAIKEGRDLFDEIVNGKRMTKGLLGF